MGTMDYGIPEAMILHLQLIQMLIVVAQLMIARAQVEVLSSLGDV